MTSYENHIPPLPNFNCDNKCFSIDIAIAFHSKISLHLTTNSCQSLSIYADDSAITCKVADQTPGSKVVATVRPQLRNSVR